MFGRVLSASVLLQCAIVSVAYASAPAQPPPSAVTASSRCTDKTGPERATTLAAEFADDPHAIPDFGAVFDAMDTNKNGRVSRKESARYFDRPYSENNKTDKVLVGNVPELADSDGDGSANKQEFITAMNILWNTTFTACVGKCDATSTKLNQCGFDTAPGKNGSENAVFLLRTCRLGSPDFDPFATCVEKANCTTMQQCFDEASYRQCGRTGDFAVTMKSMLHDAAQNATVSAQNSTANASNSTADSHNSTAPVAEISKNSTGVVVQNSTLIVEEQTRVHQLTGKNILRNLGLLFTEFVVAIIGTTLLRNMLWIGVPYAILMFVLMANTFKFGVFTAGSKVQLQGPQKAMCLHNTGQPNGQFTGDKKAT